MIDLDQIDENDIENLNAWAGFLSFKPNFIGKALNDCDADIIGIFTGNRGGKTGTAAKSYVDRTVGIHPIEKRNMRPNTPVRVFRFASEKLPTESEPGGEVSNTIYPELRKRLPSYLIKKDITARRPVITIRDPQMGPDILWEFVSYGQDTQTQAGVDRFSIYLDEESPYAFYQEQPVRLITSGGDLVIGLTPTEKMTWAFDEIFERAGVIYNSPHIRLFLQNKLGVKIPAKQIKDPKSKIAVIRAATDDNPILDKDSIEAKMAAYDDEPTYEMRRYGIFHQVSGTIYKDFDPLLHVISRSNYFPDGIPHQWLHARGIDYHPHVRWACGWIALSRQNEAFVYEEYNPSPDNMVTHQMAREIAARSGDYRFLLDLVDPLMNVNQPNTGLPALEDLNRAFAEFKREGLCTGGYWQPWDTKSERGRNIVKERLKNSRLVGRPFANRITKGVQELYLPTIWFLDNCQQTIYSMKNWRWQEWSDRDARLTKDDKNKPQDKYSHFPIMIECIFKHPAFSSGMLRSSVLPPRKSGYENMLRA